MSLPKPLELKQFYILLALSQGAQTSQEIHRQIFEDSQLSLYLTNTSLYRLLDELSNKGFIKPIDSTTYQQCYELTKQGHCKLTIAAKDLTAAAKIAQSRIKNHAIMTK